MNAPFRFISVVVFLCCISSSFGQKNKHEYIFSKEQKFYNHSVNLNHKDTASAIVRQINDSTELVMAHWKNGAYAVGELYKSQVDSIWFCYDRRNRLRGELVFNFGECNKIVRYDKRGKIEYQTNFSISF